MCDERRKEDPPIPHGGLKHVGNVADAPRRSVARCWFGLASIWPPTVHPMRYAVYSKRGDGDYGNARSGPLEDFAGPTIHQRRLKITLNAMRDSRTDIRIPKGQTHTTTTGRRQNTWETGTNCA